MRELLFRGQTRRKGEKVRIDGTPIDSKWVFGGVMQSEYDFSVIYQRKPEIKKFPVYTDTLCQCTGMKDVNGKKIFEGDILRQYADTLEDGTNLYCVYKVVFSEDYASFGGLNINDNELYLFDDLKDSEIIGNVFDNPELLKESKRISLGEMINQKRSNEI